jgi:hypothetical protein
VPFQYFAVNIQKKQAIAFALCSAFVLSGTFATIRSEALGVGPAPATDLKKAAAGASSNVGVSPPVKPNGTAPAENTKPASSQAFGSPKPGVAPTSTMTALGATTMAMQGGLTFVFKLPVGFTLKQRTKAAVNCDTMVWMKPDAVSESDGALYELSVISPTESMEKDMQSTSTTQIAQDILSGKAESWREFHQKKAEEVTIAGVKYTRIDFDGARKEGDVKISGFQLLGEFKEKFVCAVVQAPEQSNSDLQAFDQSLKTLQVQ